MRLVTNIMDNTFQSTLPLRGATRPCRRIPLCGSISIHTPLAGSDKPKHRKTDNGNISIHTPLAGSDNRSRPCWNARTHFNPHSPCGERHHRLRHRGGIQIFQSTLPLRGATGRAYVLPFYNKFQSTLPLRGATRDPVGVRALERISIHTPLAGSDLGPTDPAFVSDIISIHTPLAGSDVGVPFVEELLRISIHTPLAGSDPRSYVDVTSITNFNPHSPCGERLLPRWCHSWCSYFNPHSPCGERPQK